MESFKQKRANLLNDNPIASHGSWISKHSIAAGSPVHMGGSYKQSPLEQSQFENLGFTPTSTGDFKGGSVELTGTATIPGQEVEEYAKPGTPEYAKWEAAVKKDPSIEDKYKDKTVTRERAINTKTKLYPNPDITKNDSLPAAEITKMFKDKDDLEGYKKYVKSIGKTIQQKPTKKTKQNLTKFAYKVSE